MNVCTLVNVYIHLVCLLMLFFFMSKLSFTSLISLTISSTHKVFCGGFCTNIILFDVQATPMYPYQSALFSALQKHPMLTVSRILRYVVVNLEYFVRLDYCGAFQCNSVFLYGETDIH